MRRANVALAAAVCLAVLLGTATVWGNGGPFVVKYPGGDPAAKGVLARLDPTLKPGRESQLRVKKEDLSITFDKELFGFRGAAGPLAQVTAAYTIENPTNREVTVDFGFPILRGIYIHPLSMLPRPQVGVTVDGQGVETAIISNSAIYGIIRQQARETIEAAIAADPELARRVAAVRGGTDTPSQPQQAQPVQQVSRQQAPNQGEADPARALAAYLEGRLRWQRRDAALLVAYAGLDFGQLKVYPRDRWHSGWFGRQDQELAKLTQANLGPLGAIGEQKATQLFAVLASRFDPQAASAYEEIFTAWGGDVREQSVDLTTGKVRPRELDARLLGGPNNANGPAGPPALAPGADPTVYARVDYLDPNAQITEAERAACRAVLENLPVIFTFAPMNLLHYQVTFPAGATRVVTVSYSQYAYVDSGDPASYQVAYVLHPASLWDDFGPIRLTVSVPEGMRCRASVPLEGGAGGEEAYAATLADRRDKTGELFVAIDKAAWDARAGGPAETAAGGPKPGQ